MSNHINTTQSQYQAVDLVRLYQVYNHETMRDASNAFHELPQAIRNRVFGQVYELAGRPATDDLCWGEHHAFQDLSRLQAAIRQVAFNIFRTMPVEQRNTVAGRVYVNSGSPETSDLQWGENHANDNVDILFHSLIGRPEVYSNPAL
jgi:fido (protein-threonine AMPylation protein)